MKITSLIPSKAIRKHLEEINYEFSTLQCVQIIAMSELTIKEKHKKFEELMKERQDCEYCDDRFNKHYNSLFDEIKKYMSTQNRAIEAFFDDKDAIYQVREVFVNGNRCDDFSNGEYCRTVNDCLATIEFLEDSKYILEILKSKFNDADEHFEAKINNVGEVISVAWDMRFENDTEIFDFRSGLGLPTPKAIYCAVWGMMKQCHS